MEDEAWTRRQDERKLTFDQMRRSPVYRWLAGAGIPAVVAAAAFLLYRVDPSVTTLFPCVIHSVTGLDCMGCGLTRAAHAFLHGDVPAALSYNLIMPFWLLLPAYALLGEWLRAIAGRTVLPVLRDRRWLLILLLVTSVLFMILRNLPWWPFTWLAA